MRTCAEIRLPADEIASEKVGLVTLNQVGSSVRQDSGRDAQALADHFGLLTIAADRPVSYRIPRDQQLARQLDQDAVTVMFPLADRIGQLADGYGISHLLITGRSAGGMGALELACTETLPATHLYAAEPVGCYQRPAKDGPAHFRRYNRQQRQLIDSDPRQRFVRPVADWRDLPLTAQLSRFASMKFLLDTDVHYNARRWCRPTTIERAGYIAAHMPDLDTTLEFAEFSLAAPEDDMLTELLSTAQAYPHVSVSRVPDTTHNSFDNRAFFISRIAPIVERALQKV